MIGKIAGEALWRLGKRSVTTLRERTGKKIRTPWESKKDYWMPSSYVQNIPPIMQYVERLRPLRVLDVGPGFGKYGFLIRERLDKFEGRIHIAGIDPWTLYTDRSRVRGSVYDTFYRGRFPNYSHVWKKETGAFEPTDQARFGDDSFDLVLMIDVLEHYEEEDGYHALDEAMRVGQHLLISTPLGYLQDAVGGNEWERHRSEWPARKVEQWAQKNSFTGHHLEAGTPNSRIYVIRK